MPPRLFHVTLAFLGEVDEEAVPAVRAALEAACVDYWPSELQLGELGLFGRRRSATLWQGFRDGLVLEALGATLRAELAAAGFVSDDKPLHPHVTLARSAALSDVVLTDFSGTSQGMVETIALFQSTTIENTLQYLPVARVTL